MDQTTNKVALRTVGLTPQKRAELDAQLAHTPEIQVEHHSAWTFGLLRSDVIVLGTDISVGQETLDMLRSYAGVEQPMLVTFSETDERMRALRGAKTGPTFSQRLEQALRNAGCAGVQIDALANDLVREPERPHVEGPGARGGIRWAD